MNLIVSLYPCSGSLRPLESMASGASFVRSAPLMHSRYLSRSNEHSLAVALADVSSWMCCLPHPASSSA